MSCSRRGAKEETKEGSGGKWGQSSAEMHSPNSLMSPGKTTPVIPYAFPSFLTPEY